jgi:hypothetical protein
MDLSLFNTADQSNDGCWLDIKDFDGVTPIGCSILVLGPDSQEAACIRDEEERLASKRLAEAFGNKKTSKDDLDKELNTEKDIRKAVKLIKGWKDVSWKGVSLEFNPTNVRMVCEKVSLVRYQVLNFHNNSASFTPPGYTNWRKLSGQESSSTPQTSEVSPSVAS